jgi:hypothetical protein
MFFESTPLQIAHADGVEFAASRNERASNIAWQRLSSGKYPSKTRMASAGK